MVRVARGGREEADLRALDARGSQHVVVEQRVAGLHGEAATTERHDLGDARHARQYAPETELASGFPPLVERAWTACRVKRRAGERRCRSGGHPPLRGHLRALVRARRHRGPADGPRRALVRDRHAHRRGDRARRPTTRSSLFYALLLKDAGCSSNAAKLSRAVRRRRLRAQARPQADQPPAPVRVAASTRLRHARTRRLAAIARSGAEGARDDDRAALRARRRHRAHDRAHRDDRRGDQHARRALGRRRLPLRPGRRRDPAARPHRLPRPDRRGVLRRRRPARGVRRRRRAPRHLVRPRARRRAALDPPRPRLLELARRPRAARA